MTNMPFTTLAAADTAPANNFSAVTPSDTADLNGYCRGIYVGTAGNVALIGQPGSSAVTFVGVQSGTVLPIRASRIMSTNTTASNIVALY